MVGPPNPHYEKNKYIAYLYKNPHNETPNTLSTNSTSSQNRKTQPEMISTPQLHKSPMNDAKEAGTSHSTFHVHATISMRLDNERKWSILLPTSLHLRTIHTRR